MKTKLYQNPLVHIGSRKQILASEILMLKSDNNYTVVHLKDGSKILSSTTMGIIEKRLSAFDFFRVNRSTVVNVKCLRKKRKLRTEKLEIRATKNEKPHYIRVSRRRVNPFLAHINQ